MHNIDPALIALLDDVRKAYESIPERFHGDLRGAPRMRLLTRVVAALVPGVNSGDGIQHEDVWWSWLRVKGHNYIIDLCPRDIYPGPVLIDVGNDSGHREWYVLTGSQELSAPQQNIVREILAATEGAKRFLGMP